MYRLTFVLCLVVTVSLVSLAPADVPKLINYQGMLTDNGGHPLDQTVSITFKIYNDSLSVRPGNKKWEETQTGIEVVNGLFNVMLGRVTPLELDFSEDYWLDITVGAEHLPDRIRFTSVGYAYRAQMADTAAYAVGVPEGDLDERYVNVIGPDSISATEATSTALRVRNYGDPYGYGMSIKTTGYGSAGIVINTWGGFANGIWIDSASAAGIFVGDVGWDGIQLDDIHDDGISMTDVTGDGIYMDDVGGDGIYIDYAQGYGLHVNRAYYGLYIDSTRSNGYGIYVRYSEEDGIIVAHADDDGVYVSDAGRDGFNVFHADRYGLYIYDSDDDGIRVQSADEDGIEAHGGCAGGRFYAGSANCWGVVAHSKDDLVGNRGLYVYGMAHCTAGWSKSIPGPSGEVPAFSVSSRDIELIASGSGTLAGGQAQITFEPEFREAISTEVPIRVVVTAQDAPSALLYVTNKSTRGFAVKPLEIPELSLKTDQVSFDWIAIARQKGYEERPEIPMLSEEESRTEESKRQEEMRAEELRHQEQLERDELYRRQMLEKQARKEAKRIEREKERQEREKRDSE